MTQGVCPVLTIAQRADLAKDLAIKRDLRRQIRECNDLIREKQRERHRLIAQMKSAPSCKTLSKKYGLTAGYIAQLDTRVYKKLNPLDAQASEQSA